MFYIIIAVVLGVAFAVSLAAGVFASDEKPRYSGSSPRTMGRMVAAGTLAALILSTLGFSFTTVTARNVGVVTSFGKFSGSLKEGPHFTAPWANVEEFSTQVQYLDLDGKGQAVPVTYKGGGGGTVNAVVRWRIDGSQVESLWRKYRTFDNVRDQLVNATAKDSFRVVVAEYTPTEARSGENLRKIATTAESDLSSSLADDGIKIDSLSVKNVALDDTAQKSIDAVVSANADIERAKAEQERARIDAETNRLRQASLTPQALQRYCYDVTNKWDVAKNGPLPATWNCSTGTTAPVIVGTGK